MPSRDKWTAFLLSLAVPGVGQLWAGSVTCIAWFVAAGGLAAFWLALGNGEAAPWMLVGQVATLAMLGICSAEHAKRLLEPTTGTKPRTIHGHVCGVRQRGRGVQVELVLDVPLSRAELWRRVADLPRFLTIDPFHERVVLMRDQPAAGVLIQHGPILHHRPDAKSIRLKLILGRRSLVDFSPLGIPPFICGSPRGFLGFWNAELSATDRVPFAVVFLGPAASPGNPSHREIYGHLTTL